MTADPDGVPRFYARRSLSVTGSPASLFRDAGLFSYGKNRFIRAWILFRVCAKILVIRVACIQATGIQAMYGAEAVQCQMRKGTGKMKGDCILGIDLGTSSAKAMLLDVEEGVIGVRAQEYEVSIPKAGYAEQEPGVWWEAVCHALKSLKEAYPGSFAAIRAVGLSGQMHGLVMMAKDGRPLSPAIVWLDQRSAQECRAVEERVGKEGWEAILQNRVNPGFAFPSLLWVKHHRADLYGKIHKVLQPKDYIRYRLTGEMAAEVTDASAALMFDLKRRNWAFPVTDAFDIAREILPECHESAGVAGYVMRRACEETGLAAGIPVVYGAGDQLCQSIGNGVYEEGQMICNIGTGGQISVYSREDRYDRQMRTNTFCHCHEKGYTVFGAVLCAGMAFKWLKNKVLHEESFTELSRKAGETERGSGGVFFLPYLAGERTPHMNPSAKGMFFGLQMCHEDRHLARAVLEGVTYALRDSLDILEEMGIAGKYMIASGGAAVSPAWLQIQADIFGKEIFVCGVKEQACLGACILAGVGAGLFRDFAGPCRQFVHYKEQTYVPDAAAVQEYEERRRTFRALYEKNKELF